MPKLVPDYIIKEGIEIENFEKKMKKAGLSMMSTKEACKNDIHTVRHWDENNVYRCSFCEKEVDESKDCCY